MRRGFQHLVAEISAAQTTDERKQREEMASAYKLKDMHSALKCVRGRGASEARQNQLSVERYLRSLEAELDRVRSALNNAWALMDDHKQFGKCLSHADRAQQRLHRTIKRLEKQRKKAKK